MRKLAILTLTAAALLTAADKPEKGFKSLFNGKNMDGWTVSKENPDTFSVKDGAIVAKGPYAHLFYTGPINNHDFKNFELKVDVMTEPNSNGGIYFHTTYQEKGWPDKGFEVQVNNTHKDVKKTGGLYNIKDNLEKVADDNKWFTEHIIVKGNHVQVFVDGKLVTDWTQPEGFTPPKGHAGRVLDHGTFALQGHDPGSVVHYKNIRVKPLK